LRGKGKGFLGGAGFVRCKGGRCHRVHTFIFCPIGRDCFTADVAPPRRQDLQREEL
jgi:hypothetical protein